MRPLIGLVSGTYNRIDMLRDMVESFRANLPPGFPYAITLIDGGSTDGTLDWIRGQPDIHLIADGKLLGAISAFTRGAYATDAKYIIMANDDIQFPPGSILRAFIYLEEHLRCGAVAFADNRPVPPYDNTKFKTLNMPVVKQGRLQYLPYAQVGMFRKWIGDRGDVDWWGANSVMKKARIYAGDNWLSAAIWQLGYSVDEVPKCYVVDHVAEDELRQINRTHGQTSAISDSAEYYSYWKTAIKGPIMPPAPLAPQQDKATIRVLYLPVYEPGWAVQKLQKHGLRDALMRARTPKGWELSVYEFDYLAVPPEALEQRLLSVAEEWQPHLILTQIQAAAPLTAPILGRLRSLHPRATLINWNGDYWPGGLTGPEMIQLLRNVDLQLTVNGSVLDHYRMAGIKAAYWQIGYEEPGDDLPDMPTHDVVFLGSFNNPKRMALLEALKRLSDEKVNVGVYQPGDAAGTLYDFSKGKSLYRRARIAVGSNEYPDAYGFFSNRVLQALAAGGCLYLQQVVPGIAALTGITPGKHFVEWADYDDFHDKVHYYLDPAHEDERRAIAEAGTAFVCEFHSFDARVVELFALMKQHLQVHQQQEGNAVYLRYLGPLTEPFGEKSRVNERVHYDYQPGELLLVDKMDAPYFLAKPDLWELAEQ